MKHFIEVVGINDEVAIIDVSMISYMVSTEEGCKINYKRSANMNFCGFLSKESYQEVKEKIIAACALLNTAHLPDRNPSV